MTAPDCARRLRAIRERGCKIVAIDPRRTETAEVADEHHFITPETDALFLLALVHVTFEKGLESLGRLSGYVEGMERVREIAREYSPERVADRVGIDAAVIRRLAVEFAASPAAVCYGRIGICTQRFGTLASWLVDVLNIVIGNLDRPGGAMFASPVVDLGVASRVGAIEVNATVSDEIMPGVVSPPHGWGHHRTGVELSVARERPGESLNDILDERLFDAPSGTASLGGMEVSVTPC
jgi:anaerobic selenocysteine-containing dehydrogenase